MTRDFRGRASIRLAWGGNIAASLPIAHRLYLPEAWANDRARRKKAGVPEEIVFKTKPEIALDQVKAAHAADVPQGVMLADAGYGTDTRFRTGVTALGLGYVMGVQGTISVWRPGEAPLGPKCAGADAVSHRRGCVGTISIGRSQPRTWLSVCPRGRGKQSPGEKGRIRLFLRALQPCACDLHTVIINS